MKITTKHPRVYFDGNSQLAESSFALVQGSLDDLKSLGFSPQTAVGSAFTFAQEDFGPNGEPDALVFNGTVAYSSSLGYFVQVDQAGIHWLSELQSHEA